MTDPTQGPLYAAATLILPLILAIVCHEVAHGWVARMLGDRTAEKLGRLTLNPFAHVDLFGTVILPGMLALAHLPVFGWAKPVPVDPRNLPNPRKGMMVVGAAGPLSNLVLAALSAAVLGILAGFAQGQPPAFGILRFTIDNLVNFIAINLFLALFNLLPVPPFDGSHLVEGVLPERAAVRYAALRRYALPVMLLVLVILPRIAPQLDVIDLWVAPPYDWLMARCGEIAAFVQGLVHGGTPAIA